MDMQEATTRAAQVNDLFRSCLFTNDEVVDGKPIVEPIVVQGVTGMFGLHPERVERTRDRVIAISREVYEDTFFGGEGGGDGASFLNIPRDRQGQIWCEHRTAEQLMVLGLALGLVVHLLPRMVWGAVGGVPYLRVTLPDTVTT